MTKTDPPPPSPAPPVNVVRHIHLTEDEFIERFRPIPNLFEPDASFDFGQGGCLFANFAGELDFLRRRSEGTVWTLTDCDGRWCSPCLPPVPWLQAYCAPVGLSDLAPSIDDDPVDEPDDELGEVDDFDADDVPA